MQPFQSINEALDGLPIPWEFVAVPAFAIAIAGAGKLGVLGAGSGVLAKALLDGWNVIANVLLPGAILKY